MSSNKKSEGTTSRLLLAADEVLKPNSDRHLRIVERLEQDHYAAAKAALVHSPTIQHQLLDGLGQEFSRLKHFLQAAEVTYRMRGARVGRLSHQPPR